MLSSKFELIKIWHKQLIKLWKVIFIDLSKHF